MSYDSVDCIVVAVQVVAVSTCRRFDLHAVAWTWSWLCLWLCRACTRAVPVPGLCLCLCLCMCLCLCRGCACGCATWRGRGPAPAPTPGGRVAVGRSYIENVVTHSTLLDRACACSYENLPKYRSYLVSNTYGPPVLCLWRRLTGCQAVRYQCMRL